MVKKQNKAPLQKKPSCWSKVILEFKGEPKLPPFESYRINLEEQANNLFHQHLSAFGSCWQKQ